MVVEDQTEISTSNRKNRDKNIDLIELRFLDRISAIGQDCGYYGPFLAGARYSLRKKWPVPFDLPVVIDHDAKRRRLFAEWVDCAE